MRIIIADDQKSDRDILGGYIFAYAKEQHIEFAIYEYGSAEELLAGFTQSETGPTVLFLDIYMTGQTGMDAAHKIVAGGYDGGLIFTTTSPDFAMESYDVNADGYLKKPYDYAAFVRTMERCRKKWEQSMKAIPVLWDRIEFNVLLKHIEYIESGDHCSHIHAKGEVIKAGKTISQLEAQLIDEPSFIRCGRGFIVNLNGARDSDDAFIYMNSGERILLPVREKAKIKGLIADYYWSHARQIRGGTL